MAVSNKGKRTSKWNNSGGFDDLDLNVEQGYNENDNVGRYNKKVDKNRNNTLDREEPPLGTAYPGANKSTTPKAFKEEKVKTKSTKPEVTNVANYSQPNTLFQYASYNVLFTISCIAREELENPDIFLRKAPHDIILQSSGMGNDAKATQPWYSAEDTDKLTKDGEKTALGRTLDNAQKIYSKNRDLYIKNVLLSGVGTFNSKRPLTNVTEFRMEVVEPYGITLMERIRAAAANNGYLDHLDAPYLLTIDFAGFDEMGRMVSSVNNVNSGTSKRIIPFKFVNTEIKINGGMTTYNIAAIPWGEFGLVDRFNKIRTGGQLATGNNTLSEIVGSLEDMLNKQSEDDVTKGDAEYPDTYEISIDAMFKPDTTKLEMDSINKTSMGSQATDMPPPLGQTKTNIATGLDLITVVAGQNITKTLEIIMKAHPDLKEKAFEEWKTKVKQELGEMSNNSDQEVKDKANALGWFMKYYQIETNVIPQPLFDGIRGMNVKKIQYVITPKMVHAYSLSVPGVSTGQNYKDFVWKTYNYIFTGDNVDVLDLNIEYKLAYFHASTSKVEEKDQTKDKVVRLDLKPKGTDARDHFGDEPFHLRQSPTGYSSSNAGSKDNSGGQLDQFLNYLTHPQADMIDVKMTILGDPAFFGQSQFIPVTPEKFNTGVSRDRNKTTFRGGDYLGVWNDELKCFNNDVANPIIMLNFRLPADLNVKTGLYELSSEQSGTFTGLYNVYKIDHDFSDGAYQTTLYMNRFTNQGNIISNPTTTYATVANTESGSKATYIKNQAEVKSLAEAFGGVNLDLQNIGGRIDTLLSQAQTKVKDLKLRASKFFKGFNL